MFVKITLHLAGQSSTDFLFMRKQILVLTIFIAIVYVASTSFTKSAQQGGFKNLKVLPKDISRDSLDHIMDYYKAALGVKCGFCHAPDAATGKLNFASDEKPEKEAARYMMTMTTGINKEYFNFNKSAMPDTLHAVTCYTCHNGNPHPEAMPMANHDDHGMPPNHPPMQPDEQRPAGEMPPQHDSLMKNKP